MLKSLTRAVSIAARLTNKAPSASVCRGVEPLVRSAVCAQNSAITRPFTRSIWMMCSNNNDHRSKLLTSKHTLPSCGCGGLHTEGDKAFVEFLSDEIIEEKKIQKSKTLPKMSGGWELQLNGTEAKLTRSISGEKVTVTFNINNSIPPKMEEEPEQGQKAEDNEPDIVSTPNFVIEVTKQGSKNSLVFDCHFPEDEIGHGEGEEESALYDHLMDFLADRGVDNTFADELVELSTALEHQEYIKFLEELNGFIKCH
ncbi:Complement component 1 Q subcomponent-binding protein, mitochondrial [Bagarius yarrelli]|uniref:Complement component 1 Q subcomponent-binding protein, mitochondrial n=1 Tax=Bagarius yarrelli TaxID=175774 RepID=A0A556VAZ3_BAGYA|nr:Complement component 1 Q subcomponent-binding protein, mitochondrial [Bagarius yarrelli]